ncbi:MAG: hypothetical protein WBM32_06075 [Crocosphaera sp.]
MAFLLTSKEAININYIVNILYSQVKEKSEDYSPSGYRFYVETLNCDGSSTERPAINFSTTPKVGESLMTIITTQTKGEPIYFYGDEAEEIWQQFLSKIN